MKFDFTVNIGNLVTVAVFALGGFFGLYRKLDRIEFKLQLLWAWYKRQHGIEEKDEQEAL